MNNMSMHGDSESDDQSSPSLENPTDPAQPPLDAGFTADMSQWEFPIRILGEALYPGIERISARTHYATRVRTMSRGPRTLTTLLDGNLAVQTNTADIVQENLWFNIEAFFRWYQMDHSNPQPVELMQEPHPSPGAIQNFMKSAIMFTDEYIINSFLGRAFSTLSKKYAPGALRVTSSCSLISALYEDDVRLLHVATLGNMRGLLGRPREMDDGSVKYDVHVLSADHTPDNPSEKSRIEELHEGESVIENGQLLGRPYTRALGDGKLKWSTAVQSRLHGNYLGAAPDPKVKTPPYISAEPDVTTIRVLPGDFLVLSSAWLGECLTDEEVVGLVGVWKKTNVKSGQATAPDAKPAAPVLPEDLPVDLKEDNTQMYRRWNVQKRFIIEGDNAATHLAVNALGGADVELREALGELAPYESEGNCKSLGIIVVVFH
ncbi:phosphatase 2C-like domain-containing protein [Mycena polygramma]|nr:phosphatase 2C-like domain-containing protein [Mycena polygramma]